MKMDGLGESCIFVGKQGGRTDRQMCPELEEREKNGRSIIVLTLSAESGTGGGEMGNKSKREGSFRTKRDLFCQVDK